MATLKSSSLPEGHITQIEFSAADLRLFDQAATDLDFARSMARTLWAVGKVRAQELVRKEHKRKLSKTIKHLAEGLLLLREMPPVLQISVSKSIPVIEEMCVQLTTYKSGQFPRRTQVDVQTRCILQAIAYQMRKRNVRVTVSAERNMPPSLLVGIAQVLLSATGKTIEAVTIKTHAGNIGLPNQPKTNVVLPSNIGLQSIDWSEGQFGKVTGDSLRLLCHEYEPQMGWRGFQFQLCALSTSTATVC